MYRKSIKEVAKELNTDVISGLKSDSLEELQTKYGKNELIKKKKQPFILKLLEQFKDVLIIILLVAAAVSLIVDPAEWTDSLIILIVVILNAILGVVQESKAEKSLEALEKMSAPNAKVIRNGETVVIPSSDVLPGDIIIIEAGDLVPADARIIESHNLKIDESALTGESVPVDKIDDVIDADDLPLGDRKNIAYSSTVVTYGRGKAIVISIGMNTEVGKIASLLVNQKTEQTPLQNQLANIGKILGYLSIGICAIVFGVELLSGLKLLDAFKTAVALAVAAIPEGLAAVVTIVLAIGVQRMVKKNAIIRKLPAVETLGCTSIICSDKTGTLTQNKMTVVKLYEMHDDNLVAVDQGNDKVKEMMAFFAFCSDSQLSIDEEGNERFVGDPTETALSDVNKLYGNPSLTFTRLNEFPFDSDRKMMTVFGNYNGKIISITKGAPDIILDRCNNMANRRLYDDMNEEMSKQALRVLAVGYKVYDEMPTNPSVEESEKNLTFVGLVGMIDPPRDEVRDAIKVAKKAGIRPIMITGDYISTACAIAKDLGILEEGQLAISGTELSNMSMEEFDANIDKYSVYARVAPEHKVQIVEAWQKKGEIVAMTGDGVNDSPALKKADIGCAMGKVGTEVAKGASSMILVDDNFATIVSAVKEGRGIYDNIKKVIQFLLSSNIGEVLTIFCASIIGLLFIKDGEVWGVPLLPVHLLFVNLITDTLPAFALGMEPVSETTMDKKPRPRKENFFAHGLGGTIAWQGVCVGALTLISFFIGCNVTIAGIEPSLASGQTMAFITLAVSQLFHAFNVKGEFSVFSKHLFDNKYLWGAFFIGVIIQLVIIYVPFFANLFGLVNLDVLHELIAMGLAFSMVIIVEIVKLVKRLIAK